MANYDEADEMMDYDEVSQQDEEEAVNVEQMDGCASEDDTVGQEEEVKQ